jgi:hypothetical protein
MQSKGATAMQYTTAYKHKQNAIYNVYATVAHDDQECDVLRVLAREDAVYVVCDGDLGSELRCDNYAALFAKVLQALQLQDYNKCDNFVYGTKDGGCFVVLHK